MKKTVFYLLFLIITTNLLLISCEKKKRNFKEIKISAAASLSDVINEITSNYEKENSIKFINNFAASSILAKQIVKDYDADIYLSANEKWMDYISKKGKTYKSSERIFLSNTLTIVVLKDSKIKLNSLSDLKDSKIKKISIGDPSHVPAGIYAKKALENANLWKYVKNKCVGAANVRAAMSYVENKTLDLALVYKTDALVSKKVKKLLEIKPPLCPEIKYLSAIVKKNSLPAKKEVIDFMDYLQSEPAKKIFIKYGFSVK